MTTSRKRYQVTCSIVEVNSHEREAVRLPKVSPEQVLDAIAKQLQMHRRDDTTKRFAPATDPVTKQKRARGSAGFGFYGKIDLPDEEG